MGSVVQDWVTELPLRAQGTLLTGIRGCDLAPKVLRQETTERELNAFLRYCVLVPADPRELEVPGAWMRPAPPTDWRPSQFGHYPLHWYSHLMHCFQVVGYCHPTYDIRIEAFEIYDRLVEALHLRPESKEAMFQRFEEDRIASGTVVS